MTELTKDKLGEDEASVHEPKYHERQYTRPVNLFKSYWTSVTDFVWFNN